jgi:hypothetical protein
MPDFVSLGRPRGKLTLQLARIIGIIDHGS